MKKLKKFVYVVIVLILILGFAVTSNANEEEQKENENPSVLYKTHVQYVDWQDWVQDGKVSGTEGKSFRLEGIMIKLNNLPETKIKYQTHIQDIGWQDWKYDGEMSGTQGLSKRLEGIRIELEDSDKYSVMYRVHVQYDGWQDWKYDGEMAGTQGRGLRLEAIEIKIVNKVEKGKIYVDTSLPKTYYNKEKINIAGWKMANVENTRIKAYVDGDESIIKQEDIEYSERTDVIKAIKGYGGIKENPKPGFKFTINSDDFKAGEHKIKIELLTEEDKLLQTYESKFKIDRDMHVAYSTHVQYIGWQKDVMDGKTAGTSGQSLRLEAIKIKGINLPDGVKIKYKTHIENIGWQGWKNDGDLSGTSERGLRLEAIKIKLEGTAQYSIQYRVHVQNIGWQEWCYDGESAGTAGESLRLEAIEIKIVPKITGTKVRTCIDSPSGQIQQTRQNITGWGMANTHGIPLKLYIDNNPIDMSGLRRTERQDVLNVVKGYGDEEIYNTKPGFEISVDFSQYNTGWHTIKLQAEKDGKVYSQYETGFVLRKKISYSKGTYGTSGLGKNLPYYQYGCGSNVFFATYAIHGFEDNWPKDGWELVGMADQFYQTLLDMNDYDLNEKWTIYLFPGVNQDGLNEGWTNNGAGRTTLRSDVGTGVDLNRCWSEGFQADYRSRYYTGYTSFLACESRFLRDFMYSHRSTAGTTVLVDLHGWTQQLIGDPTISSYYKQQFPKNSYTDSYGRGYMINWARVNIGAKAALIELPTDNYSHADVMNHDLTNRYINATLSMLRGM